jgi:hypothetical protein
MQHQRTYLLAYERRRLVEAAILTLVIAEDWPWRASELAQRLRLPEDVIGLSTATLSADGLLVPRRDRLRASWAAVRCDELLRQGPLISPPDSNKCRVCLHAQEAAIVLH